MQRLREGVLLSKDVQLGAARTNAQLVTRLRSQAEPLGRSCRAPAAISKNSISQGCWADLGTNAAGMHLPDGGATVVSPRLSRAAASIYLECRDPLASSVRSNFILDPGDSLEIVVQSLKINFCENVRKIEIWPESPAKPVLSKVVLECSPGGFRAESKTVLGKAQFLCLIPCATIPRGYYFPPDTGREV